MHVKRTPPPKRPTASSRSKPRRGGGAARQAEAQAELQRQQAQEAEAEAEAQAQAYAGSTRAPPRAANRARPAAAPKGPHTAAPALAPKAPGKGAAGRFRATRKDATEGGAQRPAPPATGRRSAAAAAAAPPPPEEALSIVDMGELMLQLRAAGRDGKATPAPQRRGKARRAAQRFVDELGAADL